MQFETISQDLAQAFPELCGSIKRFYEQGESGAYILFEDLFRVYVSELLACHSSPARDEQLRRAFAFVESMLESGGEVKNLAIISIFEGQPSSWLHLAKPYLGIRAERFLDTFIAEWRRKSATDSSRFDTSKIIDLYGVKEIVRSIGCTA